MLAPRRAVARFSLLLLEDGEDYVSDLVASCTGWPVSVTGNWSGAQSLPGRLRIASKSLFFEADDVRVPVVRLPWAHVQQLEAVGKQGVALATNLVTKMKAHCEDRPYETEKGALTTWGFTLVYAPMEDFMPLAQAQLAASRLPYPDRGQVLEAAAHHRADSATFDISRLADFSEHVALNTSASLQTPLVCEPGRLLVTDARLYFQPLHDVAGDTPVRSHPLAAVAAVVRRRSSLRPLGLEVFFLEPVRGDAGWGAGSAFFAFRNTGLREAAWAALTSQASLGAAIPGGGDAAASCASFLEAEGRWLHQVTAAWQSGCVSNLDYLLYLNLAAGRSFNDLAQWPVVPWIISDYTSSTLDLSDPSVYRDLSKPVGALNPERLATLRERFCEMPPGDGADKPFLYGTHYSCPGFVMFWLVRAAPGHLLRLQNGRFDAPDRLFGSVREAWESVTSNASDVKELVPEFYLPGGAFLLNRHKLALGSRQNGRRVDNVELPPWAEGSVEKFLATQRAAMESPTVSANLHHWIDLIFGWGIHYPPCNNHPSNAPLPRRVTVRAQRPGAFPWCRYKQSGAEADAADNVFHQLTYEGTVDLEGIADPRERRALESQINEFGQCPRQLFGAAHLPRLESPPHKAGIAGGTTGRSLDSASPSGNALSLALISTIMAAVSAPQASTSSTRSHELLKLDVVLTRTHVLEKETASVRVANISSAARSSGISAGVEGGGAERQAFELNGAHSADTIHNSVRPNGIVGRSPNVAALVSIQKQPPPSSPQSRSMPHATSSSKTPAAPSSSAPPATTSPSHSIASGDRKEGVGPAAGWGVPSNVRSWSSKHLGDLGSFVDGLLGSSSPSGGQDAQSKDNAKSPSPALSALFGRSGNGGVRGGRGRQE